MKFLDGLRITMDEFIKKDIFNPELKIKNLLIANFGLHYDDRTYAYYNYRWTDYDNPMINDSNVNDFKKFIDNVNFNNYRNILNFDIYYDTIVNQYITFLNKQKNIPLESLKDYTSKSSKYCFLFIKNNMDEWKKLPQKEKDKIINVILRDPEILVKYASDILQDRIPQYEEKLLNFKITYPAVTFYLKNVIVKLLNDQMFYEKKRKKITELYNESPLFKKALEHYVNSNSKSFFNIFYWVEEVEDIALKNEITLRNYLYYTYFSSDRDKKNIYTPQLFQQFMKKINKDPLSISTYYKMKTDELKDNPDAIKVLMTDPNIFTGFISEIFTRRVYSFEQIEEMFPGYQKIASKADDLDSIENFFYLICYTLYEGKGLFRLKESRKKYDQYKQYLYDNYRGLVEKISKDSVKSFQFAQSTQSPFKEGEPAIFKDSEYKRLYLELIRNLGPEVVPDYDSYEIPEKEDYKEIDDDDDYDRDDYEEEY